MSIQSKVNEFIEEISSIYSVLEKYILAYSQSFLDIKIANGPKSDL